MTQKPQILVAAGVLRDDRGRVLIARRPEGSHQSGWWEFPGGKLDAGETPRAGLARELREELGIDVTNACELMIYAHEYPERIVQLHVWEVTAYTGEPTGVEGQPVRWVALDELPAAGLLPADQPIVETLMNGGA